MHATASAIAATDFAAQFTAEIQQAQRDALQTIHKVMLHLAQRLTKSQDEEDEDSTQARTTTQRIRLCLQAARDILRLRDRSQDDDPTGSSRPRAARLRRKPEQDAAASTPAAKRASAPHDSRLSTRDSSASPHDSGLSTHDAASTPPPSSVPSVNSVFQSPPRPRPLRYFTDAETAEILAVMRKKDERLPQRLYAMILEWNAYADTLCFGIKQHDLEARKPLAPGDDAQA
jgi:hypothetical protein